MIEGLRADIAIPELDGVLTSAEVVASAQHLADIQLANGMIPWFPGGHCDPWNHVEAAMALTVCGFKEQAAAAYRWLARVQHPNGAWFNYYLTHTVEDFRLDTNVCAYIAAGLWHYTLITGDRSLLEELWPNVEAAIEFVLSFQRVDGSITWSADASGRRETYALLTGSSSIYHSLRCAVAAAEHLGKERPGWELAAGRLAHAVAKQPHSFAPKHEFAMDWYYPMLSGALAGNPGIVRIREMWATFVMEGFGVRCVSTGDWVTGGETFECVMALDALGLNDEAEKMFAWGQALRLDDGSYLTGVVYPDEITFPTAERTSYTAAAMILACDALTQTSPANGLFRGEGLPLGLDLEA